jgi:cytochrome c553
MPGLCFVTMTTILLSTSFAQTSAGHLNQSLLAASCANCHGTDGKPASPAVMPALSEQKPEDLLAQLLAYRNGTQAGTIMPQIAKGYSEEQLKAIAQYLGKK